MTQILDSQETDNNNDDLDSLLGESLEIAEVRKAAKSGKALTVDQMFLVEAKKLAEELELWASQQRYAHVERVSCKCGAYFEDFRGWYTYQTRGAYGRRLIRSTSALEDLSELPTYTHYTEGIVQQCHCCIAFWSFPSSTTAPACDLLETLSHPEGEVKHV